MSDQVKEASTDPSSLGEATNTAEEIAVAFSADADGESEAAEPRESEASDSANHRMGFNKRDCNSDCVTMWVGSIPRETKEEELRELFSQHGTVRHVYTNLNGKMTNDSKQMDGFICFDNHKEATALMRNRPTLTIGDSQLTIRWSRQEERKRNPRQGNRFPNHFNNGYTNGYYQPMYDWRRPRREMMDYPEMAYRMPYSPIRPYDMASRRPLGAIPDRCMPMTRGYGPQSHYEMAPRMHLDRNVDRMRPPAMRRLDMREDDRRMAPRGDYGPERHPHYPQRFLPAGPAGRETGGRDMSFHQPREFRRGVSPGADMMLREMNNRGDGPRRDMTSGRGYDGGQSGMYAREQYQTR